ncbi:MAG: hypothetical protein ACI81W_003712 [Saprospiraceae bacterium]|jgi:hypothetical protein
MIPGKLTAKFTKLRKFSKLILGISLYCLLIPNLYAQIPCTEVTAAAGIDHFYFSVNYMGGGAAFFDYDNDGDEDLWIAGGINQDVLYNNNGKGVFTEIGTNAGLEATNGHITSGVITADLDNDSWRDVIVLGHIGFHPLLFKNNGDGTFSEISESAGLSEFKGQSFAAACGDVNMDGYLDIYIATYVDDIHNIYNSDGVVVGFGHECLDNFLFVNNGDWTFSEMGAEYEVKNGGCTLATTFTDYDGDADQDLLVANDFGEWIKPNALYQNDNGNTPFSDVGQQTGMDIGVYGMGIAIGDYDKDLDLDYYITNLGRNVLLENQGDATFSDQSTATGVEDTYMDSLLAVGWGTAFIDVDNDADLDLFVCNGYVPAAAFINNSKENRNRLFINDGNPDGNGFGFYESALDSDLDNPGRGRGFAYADYDNDGDLDMLVIHVNKQTTSDPIQKVALYRNDLDNDNHYLKVKLQGITSNRDAFGATIKIVVGDQSWIHDYNGGYGSHASQHTSIAHFGLGEIETVDSLVVTWPGGAQHFFTNISSNQMIYILENGSIKDAPRPIEPKETIQLSAFPNPFKNNTQIQFQLPEAGYVDIDFYDILGRKIDSSVRKWYASGTHSIKWETNKKYDFTWYFVQLRTNHKSATLKLIRI